MYLPYVMRRMGIDLGRATDKWCEILRGLGVLEVFSFGLSFGAFLFLLFLADFTPCLLPEYKGICSRGVKCIVI